MIQNQEQALIYDSIRKYQMYRERLKARESQLKRQESQTQQR